MAATILQADVQPTHALYPSYEQFILENSVLLEKINGTSYDEMVIPSDTIDQDDIFDKNIVITIDDCYNNAYTRSLFETLKESGATATFFPNTVYLNPKNEETVNLWKEIYNSGFEIGYHTTNHEGNMSKEELNRDFEQFTSYMQDLLDAPEFNIKTVRPPYGSWDQNWTEWVKEENLLNVRWNMALGQESSYAEGLLNQSISPIVILHSRYEDATWLQRNILSLIMLAEESDSIVGSVYHSLQNNIPTILPRYILEEKPIQNRYLDFNVSEIE